MIQAVIFDYGSVLSRTLDPQPRSVWEHKLGLEPGGLQGVVHNDSSWVEAQCGRMTEEDHWQDIGNTLGLTPEALAAIRADFYQGDQRNDDLVTRIDHIRQAGLRVGLLSNFSMELRTLLAQQDLLRRFDQVAISAEIGVMKPEPAAYQAMLDMLSLPAEACVFIDDHTPHIEAAQALGLHGIVFRDNTSCLAALDRVLAGS